MELSKELKAKFARIIFNSPGYEKKEIEELNDDELETIRSVYAQKIAYETVHVLPCRWMEKLTHMKRMSSATTETKEFQVVARVCAVAITQRKILFT